MATPREARQRNLLGTLTDIIYRASRTESQRALAFLLVNDLHLLLPYRQAFLFHRPMGHTEGEIVAVSGRPSLDDDTPMMQWLTGLCHHLSQGTTGTTPSRAPDAGNAQANSAREQPPGGQVSPPATAGADQPALQASTPQASAPQTGAGGNTPGGPDAASERVHPVVVEALPESLARAWSDWLPPHALWVPLHRQPGNAADDDPDANAMEMAALLLVRDPSWSLPEREILGRLASMIAPIWWGFAHRRQRGWRRFFMMGRGGSPRRMRALMLLLFVVIMLLPVRQSVLAPARVVPRDAITIRSPLEGVIETVLVTPNQRVDAGYPLVRLEDDRLSHRLQVQRRDLDVVRAEIQRARQQALRGADEKAHIRVLERRMARQAADVAFLRRQLERVVIRAPRAGVVIFADVHDWIGRPVALGERIMLLADPQRVRLEIMLPISDAITFQAGAEVRMFFHVRPDEPVRARIERASYYPDETPQGVPVYRLHARFDDDADQSVATADQRQKQGEQIRREQSATSQNKPANNSVGASAIDPVGASGIDKNKLQKKRIGLEGSAKVFQQQRVRLFYYLMRRPLAVLRRWLGV